MSLLEIEGLTHSFGENLLYKNAGLSLNKGEHVGVVGQNGTGKSTLIKICTKQIMPDVLLLDEPTNFLDKEHIIWLSDYLSDLDNAFMVVSHDYDFLEKIANRICDIDNDSITKYYGTYSEFLRKKSLLRENYVRQYSAQQKEIKKTEEFIRKNIAGRKSKMARGRRKQLDRMEKMEVLDQKEIIPYFHFPEIPLTNTEHLLVKGLSVGYYYPVLSKVDFAIRGGQKVVITGFNGVGKSTLLKTLVGQFP